MVRYGALFYRFHRSGLILFGAIEMIVTEKKMVVQNVITGVDCDMCGRKISVENNVLQEDCLMVNKIWEKNSPFVQDGVKVNHKFEICAFCYEKIVEHFNIKITVTPVKTIEIR